MRILQVAASVNPRDGGVAEGVLQQSAALKRLGVEVEVVAADTEVFPTFQAAGIPQHPLSFSEGRWRKTPELPGWLAKNLDRFDGMILNGIWQHPICAAAKAAQEAGIPYWVMPHGMLDPYFKRNLKRVIEKSLYWMLIEGKTIGGSRGILFTTEEEQQAAASAYSIGHVKQDIVGYGISREIPPADSTGLELPEHFLLYMSRFDEKKGFDLILRAMANPKWPEGVTVAAAGSENEYQAGLKQLAKELKVEDKLRWLGFLSGGQKQAVLESCDAMILPSHQENFGVIVAEALRSGKPVLISSKVNTWREVEQERAGFVATDSVEGVLDMVQRFANSNDPEIGGRARKCFADWFEIDRAAERLLTVLNRELHREEACA